MEALNRCKAVVLVSLAAGASITAYRWGAHRPPASTKDRVSLKPYYYIPGKYHLVTTALISDRGFTFESQYPLGFLLCD